jgi:hypothetical protein
LYKSVLYNSRFEEGAIGINYFLTTQKINVMNKILLSNAGLDNIWKAVQEGRGYKLLVATPPELPET